MKQTHIVYGAVTALVMIVINTLLYVLNLAFIPGMQYIVEIPFLIGIIMNAVAFSNANGNAVTFGNIFGSCFKAAIIITLISLVWAFISILIFPGMVDKAMEIAREKMASKNLTQEQIDTALNMTRKYFNVFMVAGVIFGTLIWGAIFSLIGAAIAKKSPKPPVAQA